MKAATFVRVAVGCAIALAMLWLIGHLDLRKFSWLVAHSRWPLVVAGSLASVAHIVVKAGYWRIALRPFGSVPIARLARYATAAAVFSLVTPLRGGDWLRMWLIRREHGIPLTVSAGITLGEKWLDVVAMSLVLSPLLFAKHIFPVWVHRSLLALLGCASFASIAAVLVQRLTWRVRPLIVLARFLAPVTEPRGVAKGFVFVAIAWALDVLMVWLVILALRLPLDINGALFILLGVNFAIALPALPANLGTLEAGVILPLTVLNIPRESAVAFAVLYRGMQMTPLIVMGILDFPLVFRLGAGVPEVDASKP